MLNPPTESGWYVVEMEEGEKQLVWVRSDTSWCNYAGGVCLRWNELPPITRWSGPLDLEALLQQGGKE